MDSSNPFFMNSTPQLTAAVAMQVAIQAAQQAQNQRLKAHVWLELAKKLGLSPAFYGIDPTTGRLVVGGNPIRMAAFEVNGGKGPHSPTLWSWAGLKNGLSLIGGSIEAGVGAVIGVGASWTGVGAFIGAGMVVQGTSTVISSGINLGELATGKAPGMNTSGFFGLASSAAGLGANNVWATTLDLASNLALGGTSLLGLEGSVCAVYNRSAEGILNGTTPAGGAILYGGNSIADVAAFQKAGNPFLGAFASGFAAANDAAGFYDYGHKIYTTTFGPGR